MHSIASARAIQFSSLFLCCFVMNLWLHSATFIFDFTKIYFKICHDMFIFRWAFTLTVCRTMVTYLVSYLIEQICSSGQPAYDASEGTHVSDGMF